MGRPKKGFEKKARAKIAAAAVEEILKGSDPLDDDDEKDPDDDDDPEYKAEKGKPFGVKFAQWRDNLSDEISKINIYVYKLDITNPSKVPKRTQAYAFSVPRDAEPPETHDIGVIVGSGDFDIIARANGNEIMRKNISFGPVYDELKEERRAQSRAQNAVPVQVAAAVPVQDPFAALGGIVKQLTPFLTPLIGALATALNPMENIRRMNAMGEDMANKAFEFKMKVGARAAREAFEGDDGDDDAPPVRGVSAETRSGWEEKLSDLADLLMWKGKEFLSAKGDKAESMANTVKRKVLNDDAFQSLLQNPAEFKTAYGKLCKDCASIGGAETVGAILKKLGIQPPVILKAKPATEKARAA